MWIKSVVICTFLLACYWTSSQVPMLKLMFYPTLAAFSYFMINRSLGLRDCLKIWSGAVAAAALGSALHALSPGMIAFFLTCAGTLGMMRLIKLNAAPVLAVSLIPFFMNLQSLWQLPASVFVSLGALFAVLLAAERVHSLWVSGKSAWRMPLAARKDSSDMTP